MTPQERQQELDALARGSLSPSRKDQIIEHRRKGKESLTPYGRRLLPRTVEVLEAALDDFISQVRAGKAGRHHLAAKKLADLPSDVAAVVISRTIIDGISSHNTKAASISIKVAQALELELIATQFAEQRASTFKRVVTKLDENTAHFGHRRTVIRGLSKVLGIRGTPRWGCDVQVHVGIAAVELFAASTGLVQIVNRYDRKKRTVAYIEPTEVMTEWLSSNADDIRQLLIPARLPTITAPLDWQTGKSVGQPVGGKPITLVKTRDASYHTQVESLDYSAVIEPLNVLQRVRWRVNPKVLAVVEALRRRRRSVGKLRAAESMAVPPRPADIATNEEARKKWRQRASLVHTQNRALNTKNLQSERLVQVALELRNDVFHFPYQLDFRGRAYAVPQFLQPQGNDLAKGLLEFAEGKPITQEAGLYWLMCHVANTFGVDKCSLDDRVQWTAEHQDEISLVATDPLVHRMWEEADKPWQFLAACFEFDAYREHGDGFVSHLPVMLDGTCNGLQHFSAMLRDPIGGAAVNLLPADKPQDIYSRVAEVTTEKLKALLSDTTTIYGAREATEHSPAKPGRPASEWAREWLDFGVNRKVAKRPVMTMPYGSTRYSAREYVADAIHERIAAGEPCPWFEDEDIFMASLVLTNVLWPAIGEVVVASRQIMDWLQKCARVVGKQAITWRTPDGFVARQAYPALEHLRIETRMFGTVTRKLTAVMETDQISSTKQVSGIAPNFVHSMDACAMRRYVTKAAARGITSFCVVHDAFGTHAADTDVSVDCIREAFVEMYQENDPIATFQAELEPLVPEDKELPPAPERGALDLSKTLESEYFFS